MPISAKDTVLTSRSAAAWTAYLVLLLTGRVSLGTAVMVLLGFEVILGTVIVAVAWRAARTHPGERVTAVVRAVLPGPVATFARFEIRQLRSLGLLARGRIDTEGMVSTTSSAIMLASAWSESK